MAASNFTNLYNNGEWGYMGIGPMPAKSFTLTLKADSDHPIFTLGTSEYTHIVAYNPNNTSQYAVYSGTSFTVYYNSGSFELVSIYTSPDGAPDEQTITIDYDPSKWDFHGLESLEGAALCIATNERGSAPDGYDYASISTERKTMFWYEVNVIVMVDKINSYDIYAKRAECDANGNVISSIPASTSADENKVLTVNASGNAEWATPQGGGASYTAESPIAIESDVIKLKRNNDFTMVLPFNTAAVSPASTYQWAVQTQINLPGSGSLGSTKLCVIVDNFSSSDLYINASGSTGWTVIAYKPSDATTLYTYANESYEYVKTSGSWNYIAGRNSGKPMDSKQYYTFTFPSAGASVGITGNLCFAIVPKESDGLTGSSPWNTPYADAYMFTNDGGLSTQASYVYNVPTGSGDVSSISVLGLSNGQKLPSYTNYDVKKVLTVNSSLAFEWTRIIPSYSSSDAGKVLQVQNDGTLAWVTLS